MRTSISGEEKHVFEKEHMLVSAKSIDPFQSSSLRRLPWVKTFAIGRFLCVSEDHSISRSSRLYNNNLPGKGT